MKEVVAAIDDAAGFGAMIVGGAGVGKTALARAVVEHLHWPAPVLRVTGGSSLRNIPFGALAPYLHTLSVADADSPVAVLRAVMGHLSTESARSQRPPLIVVDDAHELDPSSSALLAQLVSARRAKVLVLTRAIATQPTEFVAFSSDGLLACFEVQPLNTETVGALCAHVLKGPVLTGTGHALAVATGGNPMFLLTLLEQGYLEERNGVWRLTDDRPAVHLRLGDLIRSQLRSRCVEDVEALEVLALAEPISLEALTQCVDAGALKRLLDDGLISVGSAPGQLVSLEQPLYGDVLRHQVPAARSLEIRRRVLEVMGSDSHSLEGFLRSVSWGLDCGVPADDSTLLRAAAVANALRDHGFALRAARAVAAPRLRGQALTEIARVQTGRGNVEYAQELVGEALRRCTDLGVAKDATLLSFELRLKTGASFEDLRDDVDRWRSLVTTLELRVDVPASEDEVFRSRLGIRISEAHVLVLEGRLVGLEDELRSVIAEPRGTAETRTRALILLGEVLGSVGRPVEGSTYSAQALEIIDAEGASLLGYREFAVAQHVFLLTNSGRAADAKEALRRYSRDHPRSIVYFAGWGDFVDGVGALRAGRNREARDRFLLALEALRETDVSQVITLLLGLAAYACALAGDTARAEALLVEFERTPKRGSRSMRLGGRIFLTAAAALLGETAGARADLLSIAATAEREGLKELAGTALRLSLLLGDLDAIDPLVRVLHGFEGPGATTLLEFALATQARDVAAMVSAATIAGEHGDTSLEFVGLSLALQLRSEQGAGRQARTIQRRLVTLGEQREGPVPTPLASVSSAASTPKLTPTERRIVALVKEGHSNREIADSKGVSVRTVEGHLYRIFAKLGVNRREDLRDS